MNTSLVKQLQAEEQRFDKEKEEELRGVPIEAQDTMMQLIVEEHQKRLQKILSPKQHDQQ